MILIGTVVFKNDFTLSVSSCILLPSTFACAMSTVQQLENGYTKRGKPTVIYGGYEYWKHRQNLIGQVTWRCCQYQTMKCPATLKTAGNHVISVLCQHTHEGNVANSRARAAVHQMKEKMSDNAVTTRSAQASVVCQLGDEVKMALPDKNVVARNLRRYRTICNQTTPSILPALPTGINFDVPARFKNLVLCDLYSDSDNRILILGESNLVDGLRRSRVWLADGTFKKCPSVFFQILVEQVVLYEHL